jgi:hypothetical protein
MGNVTNGREMVWREETPGLRILGDPATGATRGWVWTDDDGQSWSRQDAADVMHGYPSFTSALRDAAYASREVRAVDVEGEMSGDGARELAAGYASPGNVGSVLSTFATTGVAHADELRGDIRATRAEMVRAGASWRVLEDLDRLATYVVNNR